MMSRRSFSRVGAAVVLLAAAAPGVLADAASKDSKIERVLAYVKASNMALEEQAFANFEPQFEKVSQNLVQLAGIPEAERKEAIADILAKLVASLREFSSWENLKPAMMESYRETYSEEDLDGLLAFFASPVGQMYLTKSPLAAAKAHEVNAKRQKEFTAIVQKIMENWIEEHRKTK
jgi:hypothetical protein